MPKNNTGTIQVATRVVGESLYAFSPEDTFALLSEIPSGGTTVVLPDQPNQGEAYDVVDVDGSCSVGNPIILEASGGLKIQDDLSSVSLTSSFSWARAVWSGTAWALETSGGSAIETSFVWRPGATPTAANTFETWPALYAAISALPEGTIYDVSVDGSLGTLTVPAGTYQLSGARFSDPTGLFSPVEWETDAFIDTSKGGTIWLYNASFENVGTTSPITVGANETYFLVLETAVLSSSGTAFIHVTDASASMTVFANIVSVIGDGTNPVMDCDAGTSAIQVGFDISGGSTLFAGAIAGLGGATVDFSSDVSMGATIPVGSGWVLSMDSNAVFTTYTPAVLADWSGTAPTSVANALDRIAAKITPIP